MHFERIDLVRLWSQWLNTKGEGVWVKYHLKCDQWNNS